MPPVPPIDLITTPVAVLNGFGLTTKVGLSADDPLAARHQNERYRVLITYYDPDGRLAERHEHLPLEPGERRLIDLSAETRKFFGSETSLAVVHRIPVSVCPEGSDPAGAPISNAGPADFGMYRSMVQYGLPNGGHGGVIYETPPGLNTTAGRKGPATTLTFSSKVAVSPTLDTKLVLIHYSVSPNYDRQTAFRLRLFDSAGTAIGEGELPLRPFAAAPLSIGDFLGEAERRRLCEAGNGIGLMTLVGWCTDAALLVLFVQIDPTAGAVSVEHAHPPQTYLLPSDPADRQRIKAAAIASWNRSFGTR